MAADTSAFLETNNSAVSDTLLAVYDGTCKTLTEIACSEDEGTGLLSKVCVQDLSPGQVHYAQVASSDVTSQGPITLDVICSCPSSGLGACCFGDCWLELAPFDCIDQGGLYLGDGLPCDPNPCGPPP